jgi:hypothetical protein
MAPYMVCGFGFARAGPRDRKIASQLPISAW